MPLYEYRCPNCKKEQTFLMKFDDLHPICVCKEENPFVMERQMSLNSFRLKGTGWYATDYMEKKK